MHTVQSVLLVLVNPHLVGQLAVPEHVSAHMCVALTVGPSNGPTGVCCANE